MTEQKIIGEGKGLLGKLKTPILHEEKGSKIIKEWFTSLGKELLWNWDLSINDNRYCLVELEFYFYNEDIHPDPYVHKNDIQLNTICDWYFHREKSASVNFTLKGIDLTFGDKGKDYGGILIRAIKDNKDNIIEGPSKVVDQILIGNNVESVLLLKEKSDWKGDALINPLLKLRRKDEPEREDISCAPRFGIKNNKESEEYFLAPYRFRTYVNKAKKDKKSLLAGKVLKGKMKIVITE